MKRRSLASTLATWMLLMVFLTGCWNASDVDNLDYVNAIGINYDKEKKEFVVYLQMLSFEKVAKSEGSVSSGPVPVWIAVGRGSSYADAIGKIYIESPNRLYWGHVTSLVLGEGLIQKGDITDVLQAFFRFYELRYTMWVFGTKDPIDKIFSASPSFQRSRLLMLLHTPLENYKQLSYIEPLRLNDFIATYYETAQTVILPSISVSDDIWRINDKPNDGLRYDGIYALWQKRFKGFVPFDKLQGLRWLQTKASRSAVEVKKDGKIVANVRMNKPKWSVIIHNNGSKPVFDLHILVKGAISELNEQVPLSVLVTQVQNQIEKEIRQTFEFGIKEKTDLLRLQDKLYLRGAKNYQRYAKDGDMFVLTTQSLGEVKVKANITTAGKYTYKLYKDNPDSQSKEQSND